MTLAVRKDELTRIEEAVKAIAEIGDTITGQLNNPQSLSGKINARVGAMHISSHFLSLPKMVAMQGDSLAVGQRDILSASELWNRYHFINSFKVINGFHNQYYLYRQQKIPFCFKDFVTLLDNNQVETVNGEIAEIELLEWNIWQNFALIDYRVNKTL